jgi:hypothetical protein
MKGIKMYEQNVIAQLVATATMEITHTASTTENEETK